MQFPRACSSRCRLQRRRRPMSASRLRRSQRRRPRRARLSRQRPQPRRRPRAKASSVQFPLAKSASLSFLLHSASRTHGPTVSRVSVSISLGCLGRGDLSGPDGDRGLGAGASGGEHEPDKHEHCSHSSRADPPDLFVAAGHQKRSPALAAQEEAGAVPVAAGQPGGRGRAAGTLPRSTTCHSRTLSPRRRRRTAPVARARRHLDAARHPQEDSITGVAARNRS
jgi:hypothetical protein